MDKKVKDLDWGPVRKFLKARNIKEINFKNMIEIDKGKVTKVIVNKDNEFEVTVTRTSTYKVEELKEKRCLDLFVVLNNFMKSPSIDSAIFKQYIASLKREDKIQNVLNAWMGKK